MSQPDKEKGSPSDPPAGPHGPCSTQPRRPPWAQTQRHPPFHGLQHFLFDSKPPVYVYVFVCLLSVFRSVHFSVRLPAYLSVCLPACLPACLSVCLPACLSAVCLPACLSVCLTVCLQVLKRSAYVLLVCLRAVSAAGSTSACP